MRSLNSRILIRIHGIASTTALQSPHLCLLSFNLKQQPRMEDNGGNKVAEILYLNKALIDREA